MPHRPAALALTAAALLTTAACATADAATADGSQGGPPHKPHPTAPPPVSSVTLAEGETDRPYTVTSDEDRTFVYRELTVQPGATGGWHTHDGEQVAVIVSGTLTRYDADCEPHVYTAGDALVEPADPEDVHIGLNLGDEPLELYVVDMLPEGGSPAVPAENPGCPDLPA
ncbi:cupin domain-containing protein [Nocardiopsis aegyptia]|uniref:Quercetin dioxygenase-like cupin family protein n=1 Tax=Nocardiopsis aegyptia TaxID=220378 RepID=A0A7Z0EQ11_9ACTN|nr:cupin domain-containing protein [Nocardiopsis aegyptia]NYJ35586.1 quercetin dioxygenase-like cupin family protein [Nocardiopsis aegyptia]